jgi:hypothetical protein
MKNKLTITLIAFLLLIPLRLPISILFIHFFEWILGLTTTQEAIPKDILATNIIISKLVYNIALSAFFIVNIELFSREKFGRKARVTSYSGKTEDQPIYWWIVPIGILLVAFIIIDGISVYNIFFIN